MIAKIWITFAARMSLLWAMDNYRSYTGSSCYSLLGSFRPPSYRFVDTFEMCICWQHLKVLVYLLQRNTFFLSILLEHDLRIHGTLQRMRDRCRLRQFPNCWLWSLCRHAAYTLQCNLERKLVSKSHLFTWKDTPWWNWISLRYLPLNQKLSI